MAENLQLGLHIDGIEMRQLMLKESSPILGIISAEDQTALLASFKSNQYKRALEILDVYSIIVMRYAVEVDLLACNSFLQAYCDILGVEGENRNAKYIAENRSNVIKKAENVSAVFDRVPMSNLPTSYKKIINKTRALLSSGV